jgi:hypothetical protein
MSSLKRHDGELTIDHRASPGLTPEQARSVGLPGAPLGEGTSTGFATVSCSHCGGVWIVNPYRTRERPYCKVCDHYICDPCKAVSLQPGYVHRTIEDLTNMICSGNWRIAGGPASNPILVPNTPET